MAGALDGVRILDLSTVILGPWAGQTLGDMGADVVKVETPDEHTAVLSDFNLTLAQNPELYNLYFKGLASPQSVPEAELMKLDMILGTYLEAHMQTYHLHQEGALGDGVWRHHQEQLRWLVSQPGFLAHWQRWNRPDDVSFNQLVTDLMQEQGVI